MAKGEQPDAGRWDLRKEETSGRKIGRKKTLDLPHKVFMGIALLKRDSIYEKASSKYFLILRCW